MSGQQEGQNGPDRPEQSELPDSTLIMARLADREQGQANGRHHNGLPKAGGSGHGNAPAEVRAAAEAASAAEPPLPAPAGLPHGAEERAEPAPGEREPARRQPAIAGLPEPGSRADLRRRLERLPYGHPSSPYHVDGERKPPPPQLRHLELAPPVRDAPARLAPPSPPPSSPQSSSRQSPSPQSPSPSSPPPIRQAPSGPPDPGLRTPIDTAGHRWPVEMPGGAAAEPLERESSHLLPAAPAPPAAWPTGERDRTESVFAPLSRSAEPTPGLHQPAPRGTERPAWHDSRQATVGGRHETLPREAQPAAAHGDVGRPAGLPPVSREPAFGRGRDAPHLAADGSWSWGPASLTSDQVRVAQTAYDMLGAAAGRSLFGGYDGGSGLTAAIRRVDEQLAHGSLAPGTDEHALIEPDVFRARFADLLRRHPGRTPEQLSRRVPGALSYVFVLEAEHYADGIRDIEEALQLQGFLLQARKNSWSSVANRCVFTIWHDPAPDLPFQVQFHTAASLEAQHLARTSAPLINDPRVPPTQAATIRSELAAAWAAVDAPPGNAGIGDYRREGDTAHR